MRTQNVPERELRLLPLSTQDRVSGINAVVIVTNDSNITFFFSAGVFRKRNCQKSRRSAGKTKRKGIFGLKTFLY